MLLIAVSIGGLVYVGLNSKSLFNNNSKSSSGSMSNDKMKAQEKEFTGFKLKNQLLVKMDTDACGINDTLLMYSNTAINATFITFDGSKPLKNGYNESNIKDIDNFLDGKQGLTQTDNNGAATNKVLFPQLSCSGSVITQLEDVPSPYEFKPKIYDKYRSFLALESTQPGGQLSFIGIAKKNNYYMFIRHSLYDDTLITKYMNECGGVTTLDQACYNKKIVSEEYKNLLKEEMTKNFSQFELE